MDKKYYWVIGSPRSGTTFLTNYLGMFCDAYYDEPWASHTHNQPETWMFPDDQKTIVFKYCHNWEVFEGIESRFLPSYYIHIIRQPSQVVYSMIYPKAHSVPPKKFDLGDNLYEQFKSAVQFWHRHTKGSFDLEDRCARYLTVKYEHINRQLLSNFMQLELDREPEFNNRNNVEVNAAAFARLEEFWRMPEFRQFYNYRKNVESKYYIKLL